MEQLFSFLKTRLSGTCRVLFMQRRLASRLPVLLLLLFISSLPVQAKTPWPDSPLAPVVQVSLEKAARDMKAGRPQKAAPAIEAALQSADTIAKCLAIAAFTESYGYPLMEVRRKCMRKALSLCTSQEDYMQVALKSRQFQFYEITRECITHLIQGANSVDELYDLARKAQEIALNDVAHMAMEKAYTSIKSGPDAVHFAHVVKQMGMDDLTRKVVKDLINNQDDSLGLCQLLKSVEDLEMEDLCRYCLKKALDKSQTMDSLRCLYEGARRNHQSDIMQVVLYRGRKLTLEQRIEHDRQEYERQLKQWQEGIQPDQGDQSANGKNKPLHGGTGTGSQDSGF